MHQGWQTIRWFLITLFVLGLSVDSISQIAFGLKAGLNVSKINYNTTVVISSVRRTETGEILSFAAGGYLLKKLTGKLSIQPELLYSVQGGVFGSEVRLHYLNVPVMLSYHPHKAVHFQAGPQVGYLMTVSNGTNSDYFNKFDFGVAAGIGFMVDEAAEIAFRYILGITDLEADGTMPNSSDVKATSEVLQFTLGIKLFAK